MLLSSNDNSTFMYVTIMLRSYYYHTGSILLVVQLPLSRAGIFWLGSRYSCVLLCTYPSEVSYFWYNLVLRPDKLKAQVLYLLRPFPHITRGERITDLGSFFCQVSNHSWQSHVDTYYTDIIFTMRAGCGCFRLFNAISCHFILHHGLFIVFHLISCYFKLVHATTIQLLCYYHASTMLPSPHNNDII